MDGAQPAAQAGPEAFGRRARDWCVLAWDSPVGRGAGQERVGEGGQDGDNYTAARHTTSGLARVENR